MDLARILLNQEYLQTQTTFFYHHEKTMLEKSQTGDSVFGRRSIEVLHSAEWSVFYAHLYGGT